MMKTKVYIAGPMSGLVDCNRGAFHYAAKQQRSVGRVVLNPAVLPSGLSEPEYMQIGMAMLLCADEIYLLDGYQGSAGAMAELALARKLDLKVVYQEDACYSV